MIDKKPPIGSTVEVEYELSAGFAPKEKEGDKATLTFEIDEHTEKGFVGEEFEGYRVTETGHIFSPTKGENQPRKRIGIHCEWEVING